MFNTILVAIDGSEFAERAVEVACSLAATSKDATVTLIHAPAFPANTAGLGAGGMALLPSTDELLKEGQVVAEKAEALARSKGCASVSSKVICGDPTTIVLSEAEKSGADLIVAGRRGLGTLKGIILGSVSQKLTAHAPCPVLTIP